MRIADEVPNSEEVDDSKTFHLDVVVRMLITVADGTKDTLLCGRFTTSATTMPHADPVIFTRNNT